MRYLIALLLALTASAATRAQDPAPDAPAGVVLLRSAGPAEAVVVAGRVLPLAVSRGEVATLRVPAGTHTVVLLEHAAAWQPRRLEQTVSVAAGDTVRIAFGAFPARYRLESWPTGAALALVRPDGTEEPLGAAPLVLDRHEPLAGTLVARLDGYAEARLPAPPAADAPATLVLRPLRTASAEAALTLPTARRATRRRAIDLGLGAAAIGATALAVHWKFRADALDTAYRDPLSLQRGDEALRQEAMRYDLYSGLAFGAGSAALGGLALRFVLR